MPQITCLASDKTNSAAQLIYRHKPVLIYKYLGVKSKSRHPFDIHLRLSTPAPSLLQRSSQLQQQELTQDNR